MTRHDLPHIPGHPRRLLCLEDLLERVDDPQARWDDLPARPGLYLILWPPGAPLPLREGAGEAGRLLAERREAVNQARTTDILYIGAANSLRHRLRQLARFGRGRAAKHEEGSDLWLVAGVERAEVLLQACPEGLQAGFENEAMERFRQDHGDIPPANRSGPNA